MIRQERKVSLLCAFTLTSPLIEGAIGEYSGRPIQTGCGQGKRGTGRITKAYQYEGLKEVISGPGSLKTLETTASKSLRSFVETLSMNMGFRFLIRSIKFPKCLQRQHSQDHIKKHMHHSQVR